jgi:hypothetical protein
MSRFRSGEMSTSPLFAISPDMNTRFARQFFDFQAEKVGTAAVSPGVRCSAVSPVIR